MSMSPEFDSSIISIDKIYRPPPDHPHLNQPKQKDGKATKYFH